MKNCIYLVMSMMFLLGCAKDKKIPNNNIMSNIQFELQEVAGSHIYALNDGCYAIYTYNIMWPKKVNGGDTEKLQQFIIKNVFDTTGVTLEQAIEAVGKKFVADKGGKLVKNVSVEEVLKLREEKDDFEYSYPSLVIEMPSPEWDVERDIISLEMSKEIDFDNGLGAGMSSDVKHYFYDYKQDKRIGVENIIKQDKLQSLLSIVKKTALDMPEDNCIMEENVNLLTKLPSNFTFNDYMLSFHFEKYEIACGAVGGMVIDIPLESIKDLMSDEGKKLLMGNNSYSDNATKAEAEKRMNEYSSKYLKYGDIPEKLTSDENYYTKAYVDGMKQCEAKTEADGEEMGWLDFDYWIDAQDYDGVEFKVVKVYVKNHDEAMVELAVKNFGEVRSKYVIWKREDGVLKIDDLSTSGTTMRSMMKYYLK